MAVDASAARGMIAGISARLDAQPITARQMSVLALVMLMLMIDGLDIQLLGLVTPVILEDWNVDRAHFGPALGASLFGLAIGAGAGGRLGDMFGRKRVLVISAFLFGLATVVAAFAENVTQMTTIRFISGLGFGAAAPSSIALVTEWMPRRAQAKSIAFMSIGTPFGGLLGSLALQLFLPMVGWRGCFILCGILTLLVAMAVLVLLPESAAYLAGKGETEKVGRLLKRHAGIEIAPEALARPSTEAERHSDRGETLFSRRYLRLNIGGWTFFFAAQFVVYAFPNWSSTFLTMSGFTITQALQASAFFHLLAITAAVLTGFLVHRYGSLRITLVGAVLTAATVIILAAHLHGASEAPNPATYWLVMLAISGMGMFASMVMAVGYALLTLGYAEQVRATGIGVGLMIGRLGGVLIGATGGLLLTLAGNATWPFFAVVVAMTAVAILGALIVDRHIAPSR
jgi:AAHS family 4-hydroxybenzoate transporter-like MFS transporter